MKKCKSDDNHSQADSQIQTTKTQAAFKLVAIAASAGGLNAISQVLSNLSSDFPAAIAIVQHLDPNHRSLMAEILRRRISLQIKQAEAGDMIRPGWIYIAPPNQHLVVKADDTFTLSESETVNYVRPAADVLFDSAATQYGKKAIAVVLTGTGKDGVKGVEAISQQGGTVIVQDRETSEFFGMPEAAIQTGVVDLILPLSKIASTLVELVRGDSK